MARREWSEGRNPNEKLVLYDDEALGFIPGWWHGQGDPLYAIGSSGGLATRETFEDALRNVSSDLSKVKSLGRGRYQLGKGTFSKAEIDELKTMHDAFLNTLNDPESVYHDGEAGSRGRGRCRTRGGQFTRCAPMDRRNRSGMRHEARGRAGARLSVEDIDYIDKEAKDVRSALARGDARYAAHEASDIRRRIAERGGSSGASHPNYGPGIAGSRNRSGSEPIPGAVTVHANKKSHVWDIRWTVRDRRGNEIETRKNYWDVAPYPKAKLVREILSHTRQAWPKASHTVIYVDGIQVI